MVANPDLVVVGLRVRPSAAESAPRSTASSSWREYNEVPALLVANKVDLVGAEPRRGRSSSPTGASATTWSTRARRPASAWRSCASGWPAGCRSSPGRRASGSRRCSTRSSPASSWRPARYPRSRAAKGKHTTTHAELHPLGGAGGGYVADTPGHPRARACGRSRRASWLGASPSSAPTSAHAPSTTARTCTSRDAGCAPPWRPARSPRSRYDSYRRMLTGDLAS